MHLLTITTSSEQGSVALGTTDGVLAGATVGRPHAHAEFLAPAIDFVARSADVPLSHVSAVAVDRGPGLFTGLRVGVATAKAVALALSVPVIPLESLDLLAFAARAARRTVWSVLDARRGEVFASAYRPTPGGVERVVEPSVVTPDALVAGLVATGDEVYAVGTGARRYSAALEAAGGVTVGDADTAHPHASTALELACARLAREDFVAPHEVVPLYLRKSDAELRWGGRRERIGTGGPE